jgi:hemin uptake protein HemP
MASEPRKSPVAAAKRPARRIDVRDLMGGGRELVLLHEREEYRLRLTSNGKLILTK